MALTPGTRLGVYQVTAQIGEGGMGQVYRATDTKLKRQVAIKILPPSLAADPERMARFQREAEVLASLNHPNIAIIHGLEEADGVKALVMELVDGEDLSQCIARGAVSLDDALPLVQQVAGALEAAHEQGIIHRDLKPANIMVRPDGTVKVLDFGLAKTLEPAGTTPASLANSPTITTPAMTLAGMILGTAAYMSPEQAKGRPADKRSDVWAFGCVLYEILTGRRAFEAEDVSDTLAAILRAEPNWAELPPDTPPSMKRLLRRCLQKDPRRRIQHIGDIRLELDDTGDGETQVAVERRSRLWPFVAATAAVAAIAGYTGWMLAPRTAPRPIRRFTVPVPASARINMIGGTDVALSPDGRTLLYEVPAVGLYKRQADSLAFELVRGTERGSSPFFSPDGGWIGFFADAKLKKVPTQGGLAVDICEVSAARQRATWGDDGSVVIADGAGDLYRVSSDGGIPELILKADNEGSFAQPRFLPGAKALLVRRGAVTSGHIQAVELQTRTRHALVDGTSPQIAATGDLLFEQRGRIWAVKFDAKRLAVTGTPVPVVESVRVAVENPLFAAAGDGTLAYIAGNTYAKRSLVWVDRSGKTTAAIEARGGFQSPRLSPDGKRVVVSEFDGSTLGLWAYDFGRGTRQRLTTDGNSRRTVWSPDGLQVAFYSTPASSGGASSARGERDADQDIYVVSSAGGEPRKLLARPRAQYPDTWSPDGRFLVFDEAEFGGAARDVWLLPIGEAPRPLLSSRFSERGAVFSPDGRWLAFVTDEAGRAEVLVQPFPGPGSRVPISNNGGLQPMWSRDGRELFYREGDWMMAVSVHPSPFRVEVPRRLFEFPGAQYNLDPNFADYDVAADGRFLATQADVSAVDEIHVVLNWTEELRRMMGR